MSSGNWLAYLNRKGNAPKRRRLNVIVGMSGRSTSGGQVQSFDEVVINAGGRITLGASATVNGLLLANNGVSGPITIPNGSSLILASGATVTLNGQNISTTGTLATGNATVGTLAASGAISANAGLTLSGTGTLTGATISGAPTWSASQTFPGLACTGTMTLTGATISGAPTWSNDQTLSGLKLGSVGNTVKIVKEILFTITAGNTFTLAQKAESSDTLSGGTVQSVTLSGYATQRASVTYNMNTAMSTGTYYVVASASSNSATEYYTTYITDKSTTSFNIHTVRTDSTTIGTNSISVSVRVIGY